MEEQKATPESENTKPTTSQIVDARSDRNQVSLPDVIAVVMNSIIFFALFLLAYLYFRSGLPASAPYRIRSAIDQFSQHLGNSFHFSSLTPELIVPIIKLFTYSILTAPLLYVFNNVFQPRRAHINSSLWPPVFPIWVCGIFGYSMLIWMDSWSETTKEVSNPWRLFTWLSVTGVSIVIVWLYIWATKQDEPGFPKIRDRSEPKSLSAKEAQSKESKEKEPSSNDLTKLKDDELIAWLESDDPTEYDLLGSRLAEKSRQIVSMIVDRKEDQHVQSIGIVGKYGSGKSSMVSFIHKEIEKPDHLGKYIFCRVSTWRFVESATAIQHILTEMLREINKEFDTFRVRQLPDTFRKGFSSFGGELLDKISDMLFGDESLELRLKKLDRMLQDSEKTIILVVEDLDRNDDSRFDSGQVQAFLHLLKKYPRCVSVLTGDDTAQVNRRIDFDKLCDYKVPLYYPAIHETSQIVSRLREICTRETPTVYSSCLKQNHSDYWDTGTYLDFQSRHPGLVHSITTILGSARILKHVLRRTYTVYNSALKHEVDWDHFFLTNVMRQADNRILHFIDRYHRMLTNRTLTSISTTVHLDESGSRPTNSNTDQVYEEWIRFSRLAEPDTLPFITEIEVILNFLMYAFPSRSAIRAYSGASWPPIKPQGIASLRHWERMLHERIEQTDTPDSKVVAMFNSWWSEESTEFVRKHIADERFADAVNSLFNYFLPGNAEMKLRLIHDTAMIINRTDRQELKLRKESIHMLSRYFRNDESIKSNRNSILTDENTIEVMKSLLEFTSTSNLVACYIFFHMIINLYSESLETYRLIKTHLISVIQSNIDTFIDLLQEPDDNILYNLILYHPRNESDSDSTPEWSFLGEHLIVLLRNKDKSVTEKVYKMLYRNNYSPITHLLEFDYSNARHLFGVDYLEVERILNDHQNQNTQ